MKSHRCRNRRLALLPLATALLAVGVTDPIRAPAQEPAGDSDLGGVFEAAIPALAPRGGANTLATVNGRPVTQGQVEAAIRQMISQHRQPTPQEQMGAAVQAMARVALEALIGRELLAQEAERQAITIPPEDLARAMDLVASQVPGGFSLDELLARRGRTREEFEGEIARGMRIHRMITRIVADAPEPEPDAVERFYAENPERFDVPETAAIRQILLASTPADGPDVRDSRRRLAESLRLQVLHGSDFAALAAMHSDDPSRGQGGMLGFVARQQLPGPLAEAVFALEVNGVSPVVETPRGFHIVQLLERRPARRLALDEARDQAREFLLHHARQGRLQERLAQLRQTAEIQIQGN